MISAIEEEAVETIFKVQPAKPDRFQGVFNSVPKELSHPESVKFQAPAERENVLETGAPVKPAAAARPGQSQQPKVGRNDPCPCGSGKKYKKCCAK
jgi:uncharacterized protein YecA (UPF0149 family)